MAVAAVAVLGVLLGTDQVQLAVAHAALRHEALAERPDGLDAALEDHRLDAVVVVEVRVHGRDDQVVVVVLQRGEPFGEVALVVVVDVGEVGDAQARGLRGDAPRLQLFAGRSERPMVEWSLGLSSAAYLTNPNAEQLGKRWHGNGTRLPSLVPELQAREHLFERRHALQVIQRLERDRSVLAERQP